MRTVIALFLALVSPSFALAATAIPAQSAAQFTASVISVSDGDTITVLTADKPQIKIRLYGIDCPERGRELWNRAKQATSDAVFGKRIAVQPMDTERSGRTVAIVLMPGGKSLNEHLVREGLAWVSQKSCKDDAICGQLHKLEKAAKAQGRGVWEDKKQKEKDGIMFSPFVSPGGMGRGSGL